MNLDERRQRRHEALLTAGVALLGASDGPSVSVRAACRSAGLTERYFYESFADRDAYVRAVYAHVGEQARTAIAAAAASEPADIPEAAVRAFVELVLDHPSVGRVLLLAPLTEPAIGGSGLALVPSFVELVRPHLSAGDDDERHLVAVGVVGALTALFVGYLDGTITTAREKFLAHCVRLVADAGARPSTSVP
ncbi:TetR/AcrR family transcriptional regulator [Rhodococcus sp. BGS-1C]|uniref:TetR/AcrR family transcriptional regulator n=1 Tax=Nocardiaceae TaxID=85025 RepID=UPI0019D0397C|nr:MULTISPECIES: TetR/AcrR family transcriptional regulator [Rhodococcus]MCC8929171.1 TetR/AcrR family transcriptional regulator [Rhodococcus sp. I2R]MCZ4276595.1 TetR/AcrR family transcriptional regulator [Rhodococcus yunnanensis]